MHTVVNNKQALECLHVFCSFKKKHKFTAIFVTVYTYIANIIGLYFVYKLKKFTNKIVGKEEAYTNEYSICKVVIRVGLKGGGGGAQQGPHTLSTT